MKLLHAVVLLTTLTACGGTSIPAEIVSSAGALPSNLSQAPQTATQPNTIGDVSFASLLNEVRLGNGAAPVTYDSRLDTAAQRHADDMLANDYFSHTGLNGSNIGTRVSAVGYNYARVGENIALGFQNEESVMQGWVESPDHQRNNIDPNFEDFGLGYARNGRNSRWVLVLGRER